jgi:hypothetical protein
MGISGVGLVFCVGIVCSNVAVVMLLFFFSPAGVCVSCAWFRAPLFIYLRNTSIDLSAVCVI